jgi:hypothetical protein
MKSIILIFQYGFIRDTFITAAVNQTLADKFIDNHPDKEDLYTKESMLIETEVDLNDKNSRT